MCSIHEITLDGVIKILVPLLTCIIVDVGFERKLKRHLRRLEFKLYYETLKFQYFAWMCFGLILAAFISAVFCIEIN